MSGFYTKQAVLAAARQIAVPPDPITARQIAEITGLVISTCARAMAELDADGLWPWRRVTQQEIRQRGGDARREAARQAREDADLSDVDPREPHLEGDALKAEVERIWAETAKIREAKLASHRAWCNAPSTPRQTRAYAAPGNSSRRWNGSAY